MHTDTTRATTTACTAASRQSLATRSARALMVAALTFLGLGGCRGGEGTLGDECSTESDCADRYTCVKCSRTNSCYFDDMLDSASDYERVCSYYGEGTPTDSRYRSSSGSTSSGGSSTTCNSAWKCTYDGQATPVCRAACNYSGTQRTQTCSVLKSMISSSSVSSCCPMCR